MSWLEDSLWELDYRNYSFPNNASSFRLLRNDEAGGKALGLLMRRRFEKPGRF
jgi:hypothetical protein